MGTRQRHRPDRLAAKLSQIRDALGLSQNEMISRMSVGDYVSQRTLSEFELGKREPPLRLLLQYARVANVYLEVLADDELDLPAKLPSAKKSEGVRRR
jgi:transcriptional regulator with XRE-family HTH domain